MTKKKLRAILIGTNSELVMSLPYLLHRAQFHVDAIMEDNDLKCSFFIKNYQTFSSFNDLLNQLSARNFNEYDFIIISSDETLKAIVSSNLTTSQKLKLLPVKTEEDLKHIHSKIGLSQTFTKHGVTTPKFEIAHNFAELLSCTQKIGYPLLVKADSSNGGRHVFAYESAQQFHEFDWSKFNFPALIQEKIIGTEFDASALYRDGQLINFNYAKIEKVITNKFGPSVLRTYKQLGNIDKNLFDEMSLLGNALGANGFVTISCIECEKTKKRYFFEADMRPNVWTDFTKFVGNNTAIAISKWFYQKQKLCYPAAINHRYPTELTMPYFFRMTKEEILQNRYNVWRYLPICDIFVLVLFLQKKLMTESQRNNLRKTLSIKRLPTNIIHLFLPKREDRIRLKFTIKSHYQKFIRLLGCKI